MLVKNNKIVISLILSIFVILMLFSRNSYALEKISGLKVTNITSDSVRISWKNSNNLSNIRILLSPEPPKDKKQQLKIYRTINNSDPSGNSYTIRNLAADVHCFIKLEADKNGKKAFSTVHAKTIGGQRAKLATPVRKVNLVAQNIIEIVLENGSGETWQNEPWSISRNDGSTFTVNNVYRQSVPVGAPNYSVGANKAYDNESIDVDHHIFLELDQPIGKQDILNIKGPEGISFILPFSDKYLETPVIKVNQVGYNPAATKRWAYVYAYLGDGGVLDLTRFPDHANVLMMPYTPLRKRTNALSKLPLTLRAIDDKDVAGMVKEIDLKELTAAEGIVYRVHLPGIGVSYPTMVSDRAVFKAFYVTARGLFHNRWGGDLRADLTEWSRPADHRYVYKGNQQDFNHMFPERTPKQGKFELRGGYHDAADFDQRPMHTMIPMLLMSAFEYKMHRFKDGQLTIPESGNNIPDLLDEALWGVAGWEALQETDGSVHMGVESFKHPYGFYLANEDPLPYWTYATHPNITARVAGLFAQASRLVRPYDKARSEKLKEKALKAYQYAKLNNASHAFILYAAGELLLLTGNVDYDVEFHKAWGSMGPYGAFNRLALDYQVTPNAYAYAQLERDKATASIDFLMGYLTSVKSDPAIKKYTRAELFNAYSNLIKTIFNSHAFRNPRKQNSSISWGQGSTMGTYTEALIALLRLGGLSKAEHEDIINMLSLSADYILGCNPLGLVTYTGLGSKNVQEPLHLDSLVFIKKGLGPMPGIPVFGPIDGPPGHHWSRPTLEKFYPSMEKLPLMLRYCDVRTIVQTNESTTWGDYAPNVKLFSALIADKQIPPDSWLPGKEKHRSPLP